MSIHQTYAVFGLGRYGRAVAKELVNHGAEVLAVDSVQSVVNEVSAYIPVCKCADITDPETIERLGVSNIDTVIIAIAGNLEASVMAVTLCKEAGVKNIIVKCSTEMHQKILLRVGADKVVIPEYESGVRLAKNLMSNGFIDIVELSKNVSMVEIDVKADWVGKNLIELNLRGRYSINVVAVVTDQGVQTAIDPNAPLTENSKLIVIANLDKLSKLNKS